MTMRDGSSQKVLTPGLNSPKQPVGRVQPVNPQGYTPFDKPELARVEKLQVEHSTRRNEALANVGRNRDRIAFLQKAINYLETDEVRQGGLPRAGALAILRLIGSDKIPESRGEFTGIIGQNVLDALDAFPGSISNQEREFVQRMINNFMAGNRENVGSLTAALASAQKAYDRNVRMAQYENFEDFRRSEGIVTAEDFAFLPPDQREAAVKSVTQGIELDNGEVIRFTYDQIVQQFRQRASGGQ